MGMKTSILFMALFSLSRFTFAAYGPEAPEWYAVNDSVMGGISEGKPIMLDEGAVRFAGILSLENRGGFSSIRSNSPDYAIEAGKELVIKVKGDGRTYYFDLRTNIRQRAFTYRQAFSTKAGEIMEIRLPLPEFEASSFGRRIPMAGPVDPEKIESIGVTLSDKKAGPYRLDIFEIRTQLPSLPNPKTPSGFLQQAIQLGVPLYNRGEVDACASVYETALKGLLLIPEKELPKEGKQEIETVLMTAAEAASVDEKAWALRRGIDRLWTKMQNEQ